MLPLGDTALPTVDDAGADGGTSVGLLVGAMPTALSAAEKILDMMDPKMLMVSPAEVALHVNAIADGKLPEPVTMLGTGNPQLQSRRRRHHPPGLLNRVQDRAPNNVFTAGYERGNQCVVVILIQG